jgi:hypothetical protein
MKSITSNLFVLRSYKFKIFNEINGNVLKVKFSVMNSELILMSAINKLSRHDWRVVGFFSVGICWSRK